MTKGMRRVDRLEYAALDRNPVRIVAWATDPANLGGLVRLSEAYLAERLVVPKVPARATAVGTDKWQPMAVGLDELAAAVERARADGYRIVALEQTDASEVLGHRHTILPEYVCLMIGNEGSGLPKSAIAAADMAVEIPQFGFVGSLNVVAATAVALYEWARQHQ